MLKIMLIFRTFYRKYAYSCYAYKKKLVYVWRTTGNLSLNL